MTEKRLQKCITQLIVTCNNTSFLFSQFSLEHNVLLHVIKHHIMFKRKLTER